MIYFIQQAPEDDGPVKVGISNNPDRRIKSLQTGSPQKLRLRDRFWTPDDSLVENTIHDLWSGVNKRGEWFDLAWYGWYHHVSSLYSKVWDELHTRNLVKRCYMCSSLPNKVEYETKLYARFQEVDVVKVRCDGCGFSTPAFELGNLSFATYHWNRSCHLLAKSND